jgi:nucleotide-binding universal stress UspA family protein
MAEGDAMGGEGVAELRRVLVPTDFSEAGLTAIPYAYAVTARGGTVHLLHVVEPVTAPNPLYAHYVPGRMPTPEERARQEAVLHERLAALAPPEARAHGVRTAVELREGREVAELICEAGERLDADAICIGSHGKAGLRRALMGSVAEEVLRCTRRPVLLVRPRS